MIVIFLKFSYIVIDASIRTNNFDTFIPQAY